MTRFTAHIINHTHWDREWFLTSIYTERWIAALIDRLAELAEDNPDFHFLLDGQTLVIEDLLRFAPQYQEKVDRLIRHENLIIGPYYCQPDWKLTSGEALLRNLLYGRQDMQRYYRGVEAGWLVDTFGHISQAPQIHHLFGINAVYVWRGAPQLEPYFNWHGADGTQIFTINLFGGYRNLYGVTHAPEIAIRRLQAEIYKLAPYYPSGDIPLFDGYDLEDNPEDPLRFYQERRAELPPEIQVQEATPVGFAQEIRQKLQELPTILGELNSGKYGAVFPGTLSTRTYLKLMSRDCEHLLYQMCEPLGAIACVQGRAYPEAQYQAWGRSLLQNAVHDCICGVSIDLVHEKMEFSYQQIFEGMLADVQTSLAYILKDFAPGTYAVSTNPFAYEGWHAAGGSLWHVQTQGVGVWPTGERAPIRDSSRPIEPFTWKNPYYEARVHPDGTVEVGAAILGRLLVYEERGDTYSYESGPLLGVLQPSEPIVVEQESDLHAVVRMDCSAAWEKMQVSASLRVTFDQSPLIRWQVALDSRGTDFRVEMEFETAHPGRVYAGMPFDAALRPTSDQDLLPRQLNGRLEAVLLGQRELGAMKTFPFHDFVAISNGSRSAAVLAKGIHAYQADDNGRISITLRRAVEWLTKPNLEKRVGDAGPFFYTPDARCERSELHELGTMFLKCGLDDLEFHALNAGFQTPPLLVEAHTHTHTNGRRVEWQFFQEDLPLSSMHVANGHILARVYNPTPAARRLSQPMQQTDVFGHPEGSIDEAPAKGIVTLAIAGAIAGAMAGAIAGAMAEAPDALGETAHSPVIAANAPTWRVGPNQGLPDPAIVQALKEKIEELEGEIEASEAELAQASGPERYRRQHRVYVLQREALEYRLSRRLNEMKLAMGGKITAEYLYQPDDEIARIGRELNQLRIKRRIYDYIVQAV